MSSLNAASDRAQMRLPGSGFGFADACGDDREGKRDVRQAVSETGPGARAPDMLLRVARRGLLFAPTTVWA